MPTLSPNLVAALATFAFVSSITPGPNNAMLMASGANFGLRATLPHYAGVVVGFFLLVVSVGLGLGGLFSAIPVLHDILTILGAAYLAWLAWKIATATGLPGASASGRPQTLLQAVLFQWVNPKAWAMALGAATAYAPRENYAVNMAAVAVVFSVVNAPCVFAWMACGVGLRRALERPAVLRAFNLAMAALLVASLLPGLFALYRS